jgi:hypothetical protein
MNHTIKSVRRLQECEIAQRMHDIAQKQIVASESSNCCIKNDCSVSTACHNDSTTHRSGDAISSDPNNKLIALQESIKVNSMILKVIKTPVSKENQMPPVKMQPYSTVFCWPTFH